MNREVDWYCARCYKFIALRYCIARYVGRGYRRCLSKFVDETQTRLIKSGTKQKKNKPKMRHTVNLSCVRYTKTTEYLLHKIIAKALRHAILALMYGYVLQLA